MSSKRMPKKNETIEVRLDDATKAAFMARCAQDGSSASDAIRSFIDARVSASSKAGRRRASAWRMATAAILGALLGVGATAPSLAHGVASPPPAFEQLDRNHDGVLTIEEYYAQR